MISKSQLFFLLGPALGLAISLTSLNTAANADRDGNVFLASPLPPPTSIAIPGPSPRPAPSPTPLPPPALIHRGDLWVAQGVGLAQGGFSRASQDFTIGFDRRIWSFLDWGIFYRSTQVTYVEDLHYSNTGYSEHRLYEVNAKMFGPHLRYWVSDHSGVIVGAGLSTTESKIKQVTTDSPLPASLSSGSNNALPKAVGSYVGFFNLWRLGTFAVGSEMGFSNSSNLPKNSLSDIYVALRLEFEFRGALPTTITTKTRL